MQRKSIRGKTTKMFFLENGGKKEKEKKFVIIRTVSVALVSLFLRSLHLNL